MKIRETHYCRIRQRTPDTNRAATDSDSDEREREKQKKNQRCFNYENHTTASRLRSPSLLGISGPDLSSLAPSSRPYYRRFRSRSRLRPPFHRHHLSDEGRRRLFSLSFKIKIKTNSACIYRDRNAENKEPRV
jgi:hypothetical protein